MFITSKIFIPMFTIQVYVHSMLFFMAALGIFMHRTNYFKLMMNLELMLLTIDLTLVTFSLYLDDTTGQLLAISVIAIAAAEAALAFALLINAYKLRKLNMLLKSSQKFLKLIFIN